MYKSVWIYYLFHMYNMPGVDILGHVMILGIWFVVSFHPMSFSILPVPFGEYLKVNSLSGLLSFLVKSFLYPKHLLIIAFMNTNSGGFSFKTHFVFHSTNILESSLLLLVSSVSQLFKLLSESAEMAIIHSNLVFFFVGLFFFPWSFCAFLCVFSACEFPCSNPEWFPTCIASN